MGSKEDADWYTVRRKDDRAPPIPESMREENVLAILKTVSLLKQITSESIKEVRRLDLHLPPGTKQRWEDDAVGYDRRQGHKGRKEKSTSSGGKQGTHGHRQNMIGVFEIDGTSPEYLALPPMASTNQSSLLEQHFEPVDDDDQIIDSNVSAASLASEDEPDNDTGQVKKKLRVPRLYEVKDERHAEAFWNNASLAEDSLPLGGRVPALAEDWKNSVGGKNMKLGPVGSWDISFITTSNATYKEDEDKRGVQSLGLFTLVLNLQVPTTELLVGAVGVPSVTSLQFDEDGAMADGSSFGKVLLYDLRSCHPILFKDHMCGSPILDIKWHRTPNSERQKIIASDNHVVRIWDPEMVEMEEGSQITMYDNCKFLAKEQPETTLHKKVKATADPAGYEEYMEQWKQEKLDKEFRNRIMVPGSKHYGCLLCDKGISSRIPLPTV